MKHRIFRGIGSFVFSLIALFLGVFSVHTASAYDAQYIMGEDMQSSFFTNWSVGGSGSACNGSKLVTAGDSSVLRSKALSVTCSDLGYFRREYVLNTDTDYLRLSYLAENFDASEASARVEVFNEENVALASLSVNGVFSGAKEMVFAREEAETVIVRVYGNGFKLDDLFLAAVDGPQDFDGYASEDDTILSRDTASGAGVWFKTKDNWTSSADEIPLVSIGNVSVSLDGSANAMRVRLNSNSYVVQVPNVVADFELEAAGSQWHHVALWISESDEAVVKVFVDGTLMKTLYANTNDLALTINGDTSWIGYSRSASYMGGDIDFRTHVAIDDLGSQATAPLDIIQLYADRADFAYQGSAELVDGGDEVSDTIARPGTGEGSLSAWVKIEDAVVDVIRAGAVSVSVDAATWDMENWNHVFLSWKDGKTRFYLNGQLDGIFNNVPDSANMSVGNSVNVASVDEIWTSTFELNAVVPETIYALQLPAKKGSGTCERVHCTATAGDEQVYLSWCVDGVSFAVPEAGVGYGSIYGTSVVVDELTNDEEYRFTVVPQDAIGNQIGQAIACNAATPEETKTGGTVTGSFYNNIITWSISDHFLSSSQLNVDSDGCIDGSAWNNQLGKISFGDVAFGPQCPAVNSDGEIDVNATEGNSCDLGVFGCPAGCQACIDAGGKFQGFAFIPAMDTNFEGKDDVNGNNPNAFIYLNDDFDPTRDEVGFEEYYVQLLPNGRFKGRAWSPALGWFDFETSPESGVNLRTNFKKQTFADDGILESSIFTTPDVVTGIAVNWRSNEILRDIGLARVDTSSEYRMNTGEKLYAEAAYRIVGKLLTSNSGDSVTLRLGNGMTFEGGGTTKTVNLRTGVETILNEKILTSNTGYQDQLIRITNYPNDLVLDDLKLGESKGSVKMEVSANGGVCWMEVQTGDLITSANDTCGVLSTDSARQLKYRVTLDSGVDDTSTPEVFDVSLDYFLEHPIEGEFSRFGFAEGTRFESSLLSVAPTIDGRSNRSLLRDVAFSQSPNTPWDVVDATYVEDTFDAGYSVAMNAGSSISQDMNFCLFAREDALVEQLYEFSSFVKFNAGEGDKNVRFALRKNDGTAIYSKDISVSEAEIAGGEFVRINDVVSGSDVTGNSFCNLSFEVSNPGGATFLLDRVRGVEIQKNQTRGLSGQKDVRLEIGITEKGTNNRFSTFAFDRAFDESIAGTANPFTDGAMTSGIYPGYLVDSEYADLSGVTVFYDAVLDTAVCKLSPSETAGCFDADWQSRVEDCPADIEYVANGGSDETVRIDDCICSLDPFWSAPVTEGERECFVLNMQNNSKTGVDVSISSVLSDVFFDQEDIERVEDQLPVGFKEVLVEAVDDGNGLVYVDDENRKDRKRLFKGTFLEGAVAKLFGDQEEVSPSEEMEIAANSSNLVFVSAVPHTNPKLFKQTGRFDTELEYYVGDGDDISRGELIRHPGRTLPLYALAGQQEVASDADRFRQGDALLSVLDTGSRSRETIGDLTVENMSEVIDKNVVSLLKGVDTDFEPESGDMTKIFPGVNPDIVDLGQGVVIIGPGDLDGNGASDDFEKLFKGDVGLGGFVSDELGGRVLAQPTVGVEGEYDVVYIKDMNVYIGGDITETKATVGDTEGDVTDSSGVDPILDACSTNSDLRDYIDALRSGGYEIGGIGNDCRYPSGNYACPGECDDNDESADLKIDYEDNNVKNSWLCSYDYWFITDSDPFVFFCGKLNESQLLSLQSSPYIPWFDDDEDGVSDEDVSVDEGINSAVIRTPHGKKTIIIDGGNLILASSVMYGKSSDDDFAAVNQKSLGFIVRHSEEIEEVGNCDVNQYIGDQKRGGNIYVRGAVKNMEGVYYAEGLMLPMDNRLASDSAFGVPGSYRQMLSETSSALKSIRYHNPDEDCSVDGFVLNDSYDPNTGTLGDYRLCNAFAPDAVDACLDHSVVEMSDANIALYPVAESERLDQLANQLYVRGIIVTGQDRTNYFRNSWNGSNKYLPENDMYELAKLLDLAKLREFRLEDCSVFEGDRFDLCEQENLSRSAEDLPDVSGYSTSSVIVERDNRLQNKDLIPPGFDVFGVEYREK